MTDEKSNNSENQPQANTTERPRREYTKPAFERHKLQRQPGPETEDREWREAWNKSVRRYRMRHKLQPQPGPTQAEPPTVEWRYDKKDSIGFPIDWPEQNDIFSAEERTRQAVEIYLQRLDILYGIKRHMMKTDDGNAITFYPSIVPEETRETAIDIIAIAQRYFWDTFGPGKHFVVERSADDTWQRRQRTRQAMRNLLDILTDMPLSECYAIENAWDKDKYCHNFYFDLEKYRIERPLFELLKNLLHVAEAGLGRIGRPKGSMKFLMVYELYHGIRSYIGKEPSTHEIQVLLKILLGKADKTAVGEAIAFARKEEREARCGSGDSGPQ